VLKIYFTHLQSVKVLPENQSSSMKKFIPKEKLGKKARKQLDTEQRSTWAFSPVTKKVESKKLYNRKRKANDSYDDHGMGFSCGVA
jgi:hypothetical protein